MATLPKEVLIESDDALNGSWGFDNRLDKSSISNDFYALAVPNRIVGKLDDMTAEEEKEFWQLTFDLSSIGLQRLNAGSAKVREILIGVNDGVHSGQTVPHAHSHVVGIHEVADETFENSGRDFQVEIDTLRKIFCPAAAAPSAIQKVTCAVSDIAKLSDGIRNARQQLAAETGADSFRIYTKLPLQPWTDDVEMVIDACTKDNPQFSVAKAMRVVNSLMEPEKLDCAFGFGRFTHFERIEP